ncbi:MAG TPA: M24 family metallopeptidase, partial [Bryobacteraceae bacterium]|nr:M24 family metallopeptidase [Bryobacteraceae bacterium]
MIVRKSPSELEKMRKAGLLVYDVLQRLSPMVVEGATTMDLEVEAARMISDAGAVPAFKGYWTQSAGSKYPWVLCTSVNEQVVHGMPSARTVFRTGDIVSIDTGA